MSISGKTGPLHWRPAALLAFRFSFLYLGLYVLSSQIFGSMVLIPGLEFRGFGLFWPLREITIWVGAQLLAIHSPLVYTGNSRDSAFFWVQAFVLLLISIAAAVVWTLLDAKRSNYTTLNKWFRLFLRFGLAAQMFEYGVTKVIPVQFQAPSLVTLLTPVGNLSLSSLLWTSVGASPRYEIATGCAELLAALLLIFPQTSLLGVLIALTDMIQVLLLNLGYDIGVKLVSFHLILMSLIFLAPEFRRFATLLFTDTAIPARIEPRLAESPSMRQLGLVLQMVFGIYLLGMQVVANRAFWYAEGGGRPKSPLYGIWDVQQLSVDGQTRPAILNDYDRQWRRVVFDNRETIVFQRPDDSFAHYGATYSADGKTLALSKGHSTKWKSEFTYTHTGPDELALDGTMDGLQIHLQLQRVELDSLRLLNNSFRFVKPPEE